MTRYGSFATLEVAVSNGCTVLNGSRRSGTGHRRVRLDQHPAADHPFREPTTRGKRGSGKTGGKGSRDIRRADNTGVIYHGPDSLRVGRRHTAGVISTESERREGRRDPSAPGDGPGVGRRALSGPRHGRSARAPRTARLDASFGPTRRTAAAFPLRRAPRGGGTVFRDLEGSARGSGTSGGPRVPVRLESSFETEAGGDKGPDLSPLGVPTTLSGRILSSQLRRRRGERETPSA